MRVRPPTASASGARSLLSKFVGEHPSRAPGGFIRASRDTPPVTGYERDGSDGASAWNWVAGPELAD